MSALFLLNGLKEFIWLKCLPYLDDVASTVTGFGNAQKKVKDTLGDHLIPNITCDLFFATSSCYKVAVGEVLIHCIKGHSLTIASFRCILPA